MVTFPRGIDYNALHKDVSINYEASKGRHVIANKVLDAGQVIALDSPLVKIIFDADDFKDGAAEKLHCCQCARLTMCPLPCPRCPDVQFCSMECLTEACDSHHFYECKMRLYGILRLLSKDVTNVSVGRIMVLRLITMKRPLFFQDNMAKFEDLLNNSKNKKALNCPVSHLLPQNCKVVATSISCQHFFSLQLMHTVTFI